MAHVDLAESWLVRGDGRELRKYAREFCEDRQMRIAEDRTQVVVAEQGSQLGTRLLGGWFVPVTWLPKRARVQISEASEGRFRVRVLLEDTLGFGIMDPLLRKKYEGFFESWLDDFEEGLEEGGFREEGAGRQG